MKTAENHARGLESLLNSEKDLLDNDGIGNNGLIPAIKSYRQRTGASLYEAKIKCEEYRKNKKKRTKMTDSTISQLEDLILVADKLGMHDAADYLLKLLEK